MSMLSSRTATAIVPVWLIVFGLIGLLGYPMLSATTVLLLVAGLVVPAIMLGVWKKRSPTVAEVRYPAATSHAE